MKLTRLSLYLVAAAAIASSCGNEEPAKIEINYPVMTIKDTTVVIPTTINATLTGRQDIAIIPQVSGFLEELCVKEGEKVKKGQLLFVLDQTKLKAALDVAYSNVEAAKASVATEELNVKSRKQLFEEDIISEYELKMAENKLLAAKASLEQAYAQVTTAKTDLSFSELRAPSDGVVGSITYRQGALVSPSIEKPMTYVSDNSQMYAYFAMTEAKLLSFYEMFGTDNDHLISLLPPIELLMANGKKYELQGKVESISGVIDPLTGTTSVRSVFDNPDRILRSGGACRVQLPVTYDNAVVIPLSATYDIQNKHFVYTIVDGKAKAREVTIENLGDGRNCVVHSGLKAGERIVSDGAGLVKEGEQIDQVSIDLN
ncbi:MAG: efflux RND transporter periplasmic adaptor subunit [Bacteroidales bacterium]|nr:efflux RND transporter periplasmic adaptor subunit [Bacteroidales bacterium]